MDVTDAKAIINLITAAVTSIGFVDSRQELGELLWRERFGATEIESLKRSLGSYAAAGQLQPRSHDSSTFMLPP